MTISQRLQATQKLNQSHQSNQSSPSNSTSLLVPNHLNNTTRSSNESWDFDLLDPPKPSRSAPSHSNLITPIQPCLISTEDWNTDLISDLHPTSNSQINLLELDQPPSIHHPSTQSTTSDSLLGNEFGPVDAPPETLGSIALPDHPSLNHHDILGILGDSLDQLQHHPIHSPSSEITPQSSHPTANPNPSNSSKFTQSNFTNPPQSPPPHILGQVVEIGFPPALSRQALAQTRDPQSGTWDVQSAIEFLLNTSQTQSYTPFRDDDDDDDHDPPGDLTPHPGSRAQSEGRLTTQQTRLGTETRQSKSEIIGALPIVNTKEIQDQAAELLAQASAYGTTALGKAASFWKQSKASLTKVIEDQTGPTSASNDLDPPIPKWMRDSQVPPTLNHRAPTSSRSSPAPFTDDSGVHQRASGMPSSSSRQPYVSASRRKVAERTRGDQGSSATHVVNDLGNGDVLFSSSSNGHSSKSSQPITRDSKVSQACSKKKSVSYQFPNWPAITLGQDLINQAESFRIQGNDFFKQGQYGNAEASYTRALDIVLQDLNSSSLETITQVEKIYLGSLPILNNRSTARLKNGDGKAALSDAERVVEIILCEDRKMTSPIQKLKSRLEWTEDARTPIELRSKNFNVQDQLGKALSKRAKIFEDFERWNEAKKDWEICKNLGSRVLLGAGGLKIVTEGLRRCSKALDSGGDAVKESTSSSHQVTSAHHSRPNNIDSTRSNTRPNQQDRSKMIGEKKAEEALKKLREKEKHLEEENNLKFESRELVESKILNWKSGKENNLRGLLIGLDSILWNELGWKKVNLSQLLSNSQLKIHYLKAISKVHPDKVPKDATIVQQLIAESVFSTLNHAWISMQNSSS